MSTDANARTNGTYDHIVGSLTRCPFCDLKSKYFIKELENMVLTVNLFPYIEGHMMVIPKRHIQKYQDLTEADHKEIVELVNLARQQLQKVLNIPGFNLLYREGNASGSSLGHLHIHIIPTPIVVLQPQYQEIKVTTLEMAEKLRANL